MNIYCFPASRPESAVKSTTDDAGAFTIEVPEGGMKWVVSTPGYNRLELEDEQRAGAMVKPRIFYLEKKTYLAYETTVYGETEKRDDKTKSLDQAQFATVPGANGDPVKAVQNLPGVNRPGAFSSQIIIEGSSPNDTRYNVDNQNIPIIFHFGGLSSVVMPEAVDHVDYLSAGFGPEFGQTIAGLVNLTVKDPQTDRTHGFIFADTNRMVRLFGNRNANRDQFNVVWVDQTEKDTNSFLNTFDDRHQNTVILNYYKQDFIWPGYTAQVSYHFNRDKPSTKFDENDFLAEVGA